MAQNVEIKACLESLDEARRIAERVATSRLGAVRQVDTYFNCQTGRLKLREIDDGTVQLIAYQRPNVPNAAISDYVLCSLETAEPIKTALTLALGIWVIVAKRREVFLRHNVRIHLDDVSGLGSFVEFEDVLPTGHRGGNRNVNDLIRLFNVCEKQLVATSYSDLLWEKSTPVPSRAIRSQPGNLGAGEANC